ncbi:MAG: hypothetical protein OHK0017_07440 [Patescibacteria group bacterium]
MNILNNKDFQQKYYDWTVKIMNYRDKMKILPVNFFEPWWKVLAIQKWRFIAIALGTFVGDASWFLLPIMLGYAISQSNFILLAGILIARLAIIWMNHVIFYQIAITQLQAKQSIFTQAVEYLLKTDPLFHSTKSTGQVIAKVERGSDAYETLLDILTFELTNIVIGISSVIIVFSRVSWILTGLIILVFALMIGFSTLYSIFHAKTFETRTIDLEDKIKEIGLESLHQATFIRSVFGTPEQIRRLDDSNTTAMYKIGAGWHMQGFWFCVVLNLYYISVFGIAAFLLNMINQGSIDSITAISLIGTYLLGTNNILSIGEKVKRFNRTVTQITDLFDFIRNFGKQSFPVLEKDQK